MTMNITRDYTAWMRQLQNQDLLTCDFCKDQHLFRYMAEHIEEKHLGQFIWQNNPPVFVHIYTCPDCMTPWTDEEFPENGDPYETLDCGEKQCPICSGEVQGEPMDQETLDWMALTRTPGFMASVVFALEAGK